MSLKLWCMSMFKLFTHSQNLGKMLPPSMDIELTPGDERLKVLLSTHCGDTTSPIHQLFHFKTKIVLIN